MTRYQITVVSEAEYDRVELEGGYPLETLAGHVDTDRGLTAAMVEGVQRFGPSAQVTHEEELD